MTGIDRAQELRWYRRIVGLSDAEPLGELEQRLDEVTLRGDGEAGLKLARRFDNFEAPVASDFSVRLLVARAGEAIVFRMLVTASTSVRTAPHTTEPVGNRELFDTDSVVLSTQNLGAVSFRVGDEAFLANQGRTTYLLRSQPYVVDRPLLTDISSVAIPLGLLPELAGGLRYRPAMLLDNNALVGGASGYVNQYLLHRVVGSSGSNADENPAAAMLMSIMKSVLQPVIVYGQVSPADKMNRLIDELHTDPYFSLEELASQLRVSLRQLYRLANDTAPAQLITRRRLETARTILMQNDGTRLHSVARQSGFKSTALMRENFVREWGLSPTAFRRSLNQQGGGAN